MNALYDTEDKVAQVATGEYRTDNNKIIKGAYTTDNDAYLLVNVNLFERMLSYKDKVEKSENVVAAPPVIQPSIEDMQAEVAAQVAAKLEAEIAAYVAEHKEEIAKEYLSSKAQVSECQVQSNPSPEYNDKFQAARNVRSYMAQRKEAEVIELMIRGTNRVDIQSTLQVSQSTITRCIKKLNTGYVENLWGTYKDSVFKDTPIDAYEKFMSVGCDYKLIVKSLKASQKSSESEPLVPSIEPNRPLVNNEPKLEKDLEVVMFEFPNEFVEKPDFVEKYSRRFTKQEELNNRLEASIREGVLERRHNKKPLVRKKAIFETNVI